MRQRRWAAWYNSWRSLGRLLRTGVLLTTVWAQLHILTAVLGLRCIGVQYTVDTDLKQISQTYRSYPCPVLCILYRSQWELFVLHFYRIPQGPADTDLSSVTITEVQNTLHSRLSENIQRMVYRYQQAVLSAVVQLMAAILIQRFQIGVKQYTAYTVHSWLQHLFLCRLTS